MFKEVDAILSKDGPLDESEQEKLIIELEKLQSKQAMRWRTTFGIISALSVLLFSYTTYSQAYHPWELRYIGEFAAVAEHGHSVLALLLQTNALLCACLSMVLELPSMARSPDRSCLPPALRQKALLAFSVLLSSLGASYWFRMIVVMQKEVGHTGRGLFWVPIAPLGVCLSCIYVISSLSYTGKEVIKMRQLRYRHKTL
jgi:hypothetical protein